MEYLSLTVKKIINETLSCSSLIQATEVLLLGNNMIQVQCGVYKHKQIFQRQQNCMSL